MPKDTALFVSQMLRNPRQIVALAPSSEALAREMALALPPGDGPVIELGSGTGKITRALLAQGIPEAALHLFELNPEFCAHLRAAHPQAHVHCAPAQQMGTRTPKGARAVVSGLPFLSMPNDVQRAILTASFAAMAPGGRFIQFTYGPVPPVAETLRRELDLTWTHSRKIWGNLPPARVYRFAQRGH